MPSCRDPLVPLLQAVACDTLHTLDLPDGNRTTDSIINSPADQQGRVVHAESEQARGFTKHLIPEFKRSPTDPLHLLLLLKDIRRTLGC